MTQKTMTPNRRITLRLSAAWALANLSGCGGGNVAVAVLPGGGGTGAVAPPPPATSGAGAGLVDMSFGTLTQLSKDSLTTAGTLWRRAAAFNQLLNDPEGEGLQAGMLVQVTGTLDAGGATGTASELRMRSALRGAVVSVSAAGFAIGSTVVVVSPSTQWARGANLAQVQVGAVWQVHGHLQLIGGITSVIATRVVQGLNTTDTGSSTLLGIANVLDQPQNDTKLRQQGVPYALSDGVPRMNGLACLFAASVDPNTAAIRNQVVQYNGRFSNAQFLVESAVAV